MISCRTRCSKSHHSCRGAIFVRKLRNGLHLSRVFGENVAASSFPILPMKYIPLTVVFALLLIASAAAQDCKPPAIVFNAKTENIFSPEQEMFLGDAMMERLEKDFRVLPDEQVNAYLQAIGDRITKHLPESGIRFRFVVVDTPYTNAHAMAG